MNRPESKLVIGFDILSQSSPQARRAPRYAVAIVHGELVETHSSVTRGKLLKTIRSCVPYAVATDNLMEIASTEKAVIQFLSKIPTKTRVIQVTGSPIHGMTPLITLARKNGLCVEKHPSPVETAVLVAKLAAMGVGTEISALVRETRVVVSRARTIGPGGFSQGRYQRRMHGAIQQVARSMLDRLSKAGMDFDKYEKRTAHGWVRCVIHVYTTFDDVAKVVQPEVNRVAGVAIRISPVKRRSIVYLPTDIKDAVMGPRRGLVVGIDAGTTVGIAIADVTGQLLALHSGRGMSRGEVIRYLLEFGMSVLIATDVATAPSFVEKLSNSLKTPLFTPQRVLTVVEKRELANNFAATSNLRPVNAHQRDALAAVAKVFQVYGKKLLLLDKHLRDYDQHDIFQEAATLVLQGLSVHDAIQQSISTQELIQEPTVLSPTITLTKELPSPEELQRLVERLKRQSDSLQRQLEFERNQHQQSLDQQQQLTEQLKATQRRLDRVLHQEFREQRRDERIRQKDKEISRLNHIIKELRNEFENLKRTLTNLTLMRRLEIRGEVQPVLLLQQFSQDKIRQLQEKYAKRRGRIVYILDPSGGGSSTADSLIQLGVKVIISQGSMSHLALRRFNAAKIPVIRADALSITVVGEFAVVNIEQLEQRIYEWQSKHLEREREKAVDTLEQLVEEYRQERRREDAGQQRPKDKSDSEPSTGDTVSP